MYLQLIVPLNIVTFVEVISHIPYSTIRKVNLGICHSGHHLSN